MQLDTALGQVREQLRAAAALGDERTREIADTLAAASVPSVRLAILAALSAAADEITAALLDHPGSPTVSVRLDGDQIQVSVRATDPEPAPTVRADEGEASARISLRLSEALKSEVDDAAAADGVSVNTWLVRAASAHLTKPHPHTGARRSSHVGRVTGWVNG